VLWSRLRSFWRSAVHRSEMEREMADELQFHLEQRAEDLAARRGLSPDEARRIARIEFGSVERYKEENRQSLGLRVLDDARGDLRFAIRSFAKSKGFTAAAIATLALGIGANTAVFSVVDALLLRELPVKEPERLLHFDFIRGPRDMIAGYGGYGRQGPTPETSVRTSFSSVTVDRFRERTTTLSDIIAFARAPRINVMADGLAETASTLLVSGNYFTALGVGPFVGRTLGPSDDARDAQPVGVLSHRYWERRFARDPQIVGKTIEINRIPVLIVGVTPAGFHGIRISETIDVTLPIAMARSISYNNGLAQPPWMWWLEMMGRLKPGATREQALAELLPVFQDSVRETWALRPPSEATSPRSGNGMPQLRLQPGAQGPDGPRLDAQQILVNVFAVVVAVLLIGSVNLANLLLVRASARRGEVSMRMTLGAGRGRVIRQLLTESLLLAISGGAAGALVAFWGKDFMRWLPGPEPLVDARIDLRVLAFAALLSTITALAFGIGPAVRATRTDLAPSLKQTAQKGSIARGLATRILLGTQVAISLVLLISAGLFARTLYNFGNVDVGFDTSNLLVFRLRPAVQNPAATYDLYDRIVSAVDAVPGVRATTHSAMPLIASSEWSTEIRPDRDGKDQEAWVQAVRPNFIATLGIPLLAGRPLAAGDVEGRPRVAVVNRTMARQILHTDNPIGRRFAFVRGPDRDVPIEVVGVVGDSNYSRLSGTAPPTLYMPHRQVSPRDLNIQVRTASDPLVLAPAIREAIRGVDPHLPVVDMKTQEQQIALSTSKPRAFAWLTAAASLIGLLLASVGLYGIVSYETSRRTNEIGIRMALGARRLDVLRLVMSQTMRIVAIGAAAGCALAVAASRLMASMLFNITPGDPLTMAAAAAALLTVAFLAAYVPACRAARLDPTLALRYE
jgi:predicted permease